MPDAFSPAAADFSGIADTRDTNEPRLLIGDVIHKAFVEVGETGTEAAAATAVIEEVGSAPVEDEPVVMRLDRPFLFLIRHDSGTILFAGRLLNRGE